MITQFLDPPSNTGSKCQNLASAPLASSQIRYSVGVDWLQGVLEFADFNSIRDALEALALMVGDELLWQEDIPWRCGVLWHHSVTSVLGIKIAWNDAAEGLPCKSLISFPGTFWSALEAKYSDTFMCQIFNIFTVLLTYKFRATRLDSRIDDYSKTISYEMLSEAIDNRNFALVKKADPRRPIHVDSGHSLGWTVYFGSAQSDKLVRIYDKATESKGLIDSVRLEVQYRDERANHIFQSICFDLPNYFDLDSEQEYEELASQYLAGIVTGAVTFVDKNSGDRLSRQALLPWWESFINAVACGIRVPSSRPQTSAQITENWLHYQVSRSLYKFTLLLGDKFYYLIDDLVKHGREKMNSIDFSWVNVFRDQYVDWRPVL